MTILVTMSKPRTDADNDDVATHPQLHLRRGQTVPTALQPNRTCPICTTSFVPQGRAIYCSHACRQRAFHLRWLQDRQLRLLEAASPLRRRRNLLAQTIYECPRCEARLVSERRCPDCNLMCKRVGLGGECPHCSEPVLLADLFPDVEL